MPKKINLEKVTRIANKNKLNTRQTALVIAHLEDPKKSGYKCARESGYSHNTARTNPLAKANVRQAITDYIRGGNLDSKIQRHYDEALDLSVEDGNTLQDKLSIIGTKQQVIKEIHKIGGHYAPVKSASVSFSLPSWPKMEDDEDA